MRKIKTYEAKVLLNSYKKFLVYSCKKSIFGKPKIAEDEIDNLPMTDIIFYRSKVFKRRKRAIKLINLFCKKNPYNLTEKNLKLVNSWKNYKRDRFFFIRHDSEYTYIADDENVYAVKSLTTDLKKKIKGKNPKPIETILLPYKDKIVYDGISLVMDIHFGKDLVKGLLEDISEIEKEKGIVYSLNNIGD
jgi:hypothetical protein